MNETDPSLFVLLVSLCHDLDAVMYIRRLRRRADSVGQEGIRGLRRAEEILRMPGSGSFLDPRHEPQQLSESQAALLFERIVGHTRLRRPTHPGRWKIVEPELQRRAEEEDRPTAAVLSDAILSSVGFALSTVTVRGGDEKTRLKPFLNALNERVTEYICPEWRKRWRRKKKGYAPVQEVSFDETGEATEDGAGRHELIGDELSAGEFEEKIFQRQLADRARELATDRQWRAVEKRLAGETLTAADRSALRDCRGNLEKAYLTALWLE